MRTHWSHTDEPSIHVIGTEYVSHLPYCIYSFDIYTEHKEHLQTQQDRPNTNGTSDLDNTNSSYFEFITQFYLGCR